MSDIPEAAVQAAKDAISNLRWSDEWPARTEQYARAAIEAAMPYLHAALTVRGYQTAEAHGRHAGQAAEFQRILSLAKNVRAHYACQCEQPDQPARTEPGYDFADLLEMEPEHDPDA